MEYFIFNSCNLSTISFINSFASKAVGCPLMQSINSF
nr:MAG TPA: hypothetical protein [Caudoviricetes sp.]